MEGTRMHTLAPRDTGNDTRGWILCIASGLACVVGAFAIYIDKLICLLPGKRNFRIQESHEFQACSLSLSFGVMLFSSLYSMLPEARQNLMDSKFDQKIAGLIMMGCFIGGFLGIQAFTRLLHQFMPSDVVDCDHTHGDDVSEDNHAHVHSQRPDSQHGSTSRKRKDGSGSNRTRSRLGSQEYQDNLGESTPLLGENLNGASKPSSRRTASKTGEMAQKLIHPSTSALQRSVTNPQESALSRRSSMAGMQKRVISFVKDTKRDCSENGSCYGYTDPCGKECYKHSVLRTGPTRSRYSNFLRTHSSPFNSHAGSIPRDSGAGAADEGIESQDPLQRTNSATSCDSLDLTTEEDQDENLGGLERHEHGQDEARYEEHFSADEDVESQHHHHVPTNAFLSIGLQTSVAITIHKFPEGFVTFATNHANPTLGLNVFLALFVHNICEGFTLALPLYMALNSRWKALAWASILGGLSQPLGALIAFIVLEVSKNSNMAPNAVAYACLFAATAGMMVSVALQLFVESMSLSHNRNVCMLFGFLGMALLGLSNALFGGH